MQYSLQKMESIHMRHFDTMKGDHISCMNSPYIEENVKKILDL